MNAKIYLYIDETVVGPLGYDELVQYAQEGRVNENTQACWEGSEEWGILSNMVKMRREESEPIEEEKIKSFGKSIGVGIKSVSFKLANLAGEKLRDISEKRAQAKLAKQTVDAFPKDLQDALNDGVFTEDEERHLR